MKRFLCLLLTSIVLTACGGGTREEQRLTTVQSMSPPDATEQPFIAHAARNERAGILAVSASATFGDAATQLLNFAESSFPQFFPSNRTNSAAGTWTYRYYPENGAFLIVDGEKILVASGPFGPSIIFVGVISDFLSVSFPLQSAYQSRVSAGSIDKYTVSGTCNGRATFTTAPASAAFFEGSLAIASANTAAVNYTDCQPASSAATAVSYFDSNYGLVGTSNPGIEYTKISSTSSLLPATVRVGDSGIYNTLVVYSNSAKTTILGQRVLSYAIESATPTSATVNLITRNYNTAGQLTFTQQSRFRIDGAGQLSSLSIDIQLSTIGTTHLVYSKAQ
jgi:hypothetical protein